MYQFRFEPERQHLFHPDYAVQLAEAREDMRQRLPALLKDAGMQEEHIPLIRQFEDVMLQCVRFGTLPASLMLELDVVSSEPDPTLLAEQHDLVQKAFATEFPFFKRALYCITQDEDWWNGEPVFLVNDANTYIMYLRYRFSFRVQAVRDHTPKRRGRPRNEEAHAVKAEQASRYKEWIESCRAYKQEIADAADELHQVESSVREQIEQVEKECAERIATIRKNVEDKKVSLRLLKARGAPKWIP